MHILHIGFNSIHDRSFRTERPEGTEGYMLIVLKTPAVFELYGEKNIVDRNSIVIYDKHTPHCYYAIEDVFVNDWIHFDTDYDTDFFRSLDLPLNSIIKFGDVKYEFYPLCKNSDNEDKTAVPESTVSEITVAEEAEKPDDNGKVDIEFKGKIKEILDWRYKYEPLTAIPAKFTATELAANRREKLGGENYGLYVGKPSFLTENETGKLSGKRRGDAYHKLMEHIPFDRVLSAENIQTYIESPAADFLTVAEKKSIDPADIVKFFESNTAKRIITAAAKGNVYREYPIFHKLDAAQYDPAIFGAESREELIGAEPYVQGIADMFFIEDGEIVLIDYKSDRTDNEQTYIDDYKLQLDIYKEALEQEFSMPVKQMLIYSFTLGHFIDTQKGGK